MSDFISPGRIASLKNGIETKTGGSYADLTGAVQALVDGYGSAPVLEELNITENGEYTPGEGVDGFSKVVANVAAGGTTDVLLWEGEIEFSNVSTSQMDIPIDDMTCDRYIVDTWVIETGTVADGVVSVDDKPTIPASSNRWAKVSTSDYPYYNGAKVESINVIMGSTEQTIVCAGSGGLAMRGSISNEYIAFANGSPPIGVSFSDNGLIFRPSSGRCFCTTGYYAKFRYTVMGIKGLLHELLYC